MTFHAEGPNVFTTRDGLEIRWIGPDYVTHAVQGTEVPEVGVQLWARCGIGHVPPDEAIYGNVDVTCLNCAAILMNRLPPPRLC